MSLHPTNHRTLTGVGTSSPRSLCAALTLAAFGAVGVIAPASVQAEERVVQFELGFGGQISPEYEGSDQYTASPTGSFSLQKLQFGRINFNSDPDRVGYSFAPSFRYLAERESADFAELAGIPDNDAALELGIRVTYDWERYRVFGQVRKGVTGHHGIAGELGADLKLDLSNSTKLTFGPRVAFGDSNYMSYAFDVPTTATALAAYDTGGGLKSFGAEARVRYDFNTKTAIEGRLLWEKFVDGAADSPIVQSGDRDQVQIGIMLVRSFQIRF